MAQRSTKYMYTDVNDALQALRAAEQDVAADYGEDMVEEGYSDLVEGIAFDCSPQVRKEFLARTRGW
jgi:hypothetical protein